jgi:hypothetical protein
MHTLLVALRVLGWTSLVLAGLGFAWLALVVYGAAKQSPGPQTQVDAEPEYPPSKPRDTKPRTRTF